MNQNQQTIGWFFFDPKNKTVLLHRRDHRARQSPNMWDCFGGEIEKGESPRKALVREIEEELDIRVPETEMIPLIQDKTQQIYYIYFLDWLTRVIRLGEGAGYAWFSIEDALDLKKDLHANAYKILSKFKGTLTKSRKKEVMEIENKRIRRRINSLRGRQGHYGAGEIFSEKSSPR